jgi:lipopolysaccharide biosynthesis protein
MPEITTMQEKRSAIYVLTQDPHVPAAIALALARLQGLAGEVLVVRPPRLPPETEAVLSATTGLRQLEAPAPVTPMTGMRAGILALLEGGPPDEILVTGSHVFGPVAGAFEDLLQAAEPQAAVLAPYWHDLALDSRLTAERDPADPDPRSPYLDFTLFRQPLLRQPAFADFWRGLVLRGEHWADFVAGTLGLARLVRALGCQTAYPQAREDLETCDPRLFEVDRALSQGAPVLPLAALTLDPLLHDLNAINLRRAVDWLRARDPELYAVVVQTALRHLPMRDFATIADQYEIVADRARAVNKSKWSFGAVAVFIHAYYPEAMADFWEVIGRIPCETHLFITAADTAGQDRIEDFLDQRGLPQQQFEVRVVGQNRGRDMSSLFITWRDIVLSGRYELCLRLHSKRTPQVSRQVGNSFKFHLLDNLAHGRGYVSNLLDRLEAEPDIGLVVPPVIHMGFGTLGHSWYNNRAPLAAWARALQLDVPLDEFTPVTAYGTMYWFRPEALRPLFDWPWRWEDYNPEPHHVDGGLAHVQERLIGVCAQARGFRILQVMNARDAARGYAHLEYKLQLLAGKLGSATILGQSRELDAARGRLRSRLVRGLQLVYAGLLRRFPQSRGMLAPARVAVMWLLRMPGRA